MAKFCTSCGKEIEEGSGFCPFCGVSLVGEPVPESSVAPVIEEPKKEEPMMSQPEPKSAPVYEAYLEEGKTGKGLGWITFLRVILWIIFAAGILSTLFFVYEAEVFDYDALMGIVYILGGVLGSFIVVAGGMVALNNATNIRSTAINTAKMVKLLQQQNKK